MRYLFTNAVSILALLGMTLGQLLPVTAEADMAPRLKKFVHAYTQANTVKRGQVRERFAVTLRTRNGRPLVPVVVSRAAFQALRAESRLTRFAARVDKRSRDYVRLLVPPAQVERLSAAFSGLHLRLPYPVTPAAGSGTTVAQSVVETGADSYQNAGVTGAGVDVAVVDLGFIGLTSLIGSGELPANTVSVDFTGTGIEADYSHGAGVAEFVADMAPGATIHCLKIGDLTDLQNAADYIANNNIRIANMSVVWTLTSYYDNSGPVNDIINLSAQNDNVLWAIPSGNLARRHWRGGWTDADNDSLLEFAGVDETLGLSSTNRPVQVFLNWDQYGATNKTNLDFYLLDNAQNVVASSNDSQGPMDLPAETIEYSYNTAEAPYSLRVEHVSGNINNLDMTIYAFNHNVEHFVTASSLPDPSNAADALTVGAVHINQWNLATPLIRNFSGQGPSNDGRTKPDIAAPDGTASVTFGAVSGGTSISSPTAAGAAALLLSMDTQLSTSALKDLLRDFAEDVGSPGVDYTFGGGLLDLTGVDMDGDTLANPVEFNLGTDPLSADSDADGSSDFDEVNIDGDPTSYQAGVDTDPNNPDTDGDGISDGEDANPLIPDLPIPLMPLAAMVLLATAMIAVRRYRKTG